MVFKCFYTLQILISQSMLRFALSESICNHLYCNSETNTAHLYENERFSFKYRDLDIKETYLICEELMSP